MHGRRFKKIVHFYNYTQKEHIRLEFIKKYSHSNGHPPRILLKNLLQKRSNKSLSYSAADCLCIIYLINIQKKTVKSAVLHL